MPATNEQPTGVHLIGGRYVLHGEIAHGGMATVHLGRLMGPVGFARTVAVKRLHPHLARDPEFVRAFVDEARIAARVRHPNVVPILDVHRESNELFLILEYVVGESLWQLVRCARALGEAVPPDVASSILVGVLHGLHAAHEALDQEGNPLGIVHRDISPQNVIVGTDGVARVLDFGVAKAASRLQTTGAGQTKGKRFYLAPEQILADEVSTRTDVFAAGIVLWELLTGARFYGDPARGEPDYRVLERPVVPPSGVASGVLERHASIPPALDAVVVRALARDPSRRYGTARELALAIERALAPAPGWRVGEWVARIGKDGITQRAGQVAAIERSATEGAARELPASLARLVAAAPPVGSPPPSGDPSARTVTDAVPPRASIAASTNRKRRWRSAVAMLSFLTLAAAVLFGLRFGWSPPPLASSSPATALAAPPPSVAREATPTVPTPRAEVEAPAPQPPPVIASVRASEADAMPPRRSTSRGPAPVRRCSPPYSVDATGIRHLKPECM
jgi:serine/threonine-protein kinase